MTQMLHLYPPVRRSPRLSGSAAAPGAPGDALGQLGISTPARSVPVDADASALLRAVASVVGGSQQSFVYKALDHSGLPSDCGERCKEKKVHVSVRHSTF